MNMTSAVNSPALLADEKRSSGVPCCLLSTSKVMVSIMVVPVGQVRVFS